MTLVREPQFKTRIRIEEVGKKLKRSVTFPAPGPHPVNFFGAGESPDGSTSEGYSCHEILYYTQ
ncbi:hypothetical protein M413DRAFT_448363 [Hebeloma cylindrosporum]|uniref:Uncharacterized protein n=1 Tax=Hebeloma cylindrosporum TaxID=76867 RepID=A0A0C2XI95_HEBCY|nr:hypothetical protein M413DRAFT_448363 [Hebeloma cylindrosporum h7]